MGFGHRPDSHGAGQPSAKSLWSLAVSAKPSKASASQNKSSKASASRRKSSKASASRHKSSKDSATAVRPSLQRTRTRPVGQVFKGFCSGRSAKSSKVSAQAVRPSLQRFRPRPVGQVLMVSVRLTRHRAAGWVPISPPYRYTSQQLNMLLEDLAATHSNWFSYFISL